MKRKIWFEGETLLYASDWNKANYRYSLITSADKRIGRHGADEIKLHPFFAGVDWDSLRSIDAPFKPQLKSITDTSYFPTDELENIPDAPAVAAVRAHEESGAPFSSDDTGLPFIGYTYKRL